MGIPLWPGQNPKYPAPSSSRSRDRTDKTLGASRVSRDRRTAFSIHPSSSSTSPYNVSQGGAHARFAARANSNRDATLGQQNSYRRPRSSQTLIELLRTAPRRNIGGVNIFEFSRLGRGGGNEDDDEEREDETRESASRDPAAPLRSHIAAVVAAAAGIDGLGDRERSLSPDSYQWERVAHDLGLATACDEVWESDDFEDFLRARSSEPSTSSPSSSSTLSVPALVSLSSLAPPPFPPRNRDPAEPSASTASYLPPPPSTGPFPMAVFNLVRPPPPSSEQQNDENTPAGQQPSPSTSNPGLLLQTLQRQLARREQQRLQHQANLQDEFDSILARATAQERQIRERGLTGLTPEHQQRQQQIMMMMDGLNASRRLSIRQDRESGEGNGNGGEGVPDEMGGLLGGYAALRARRERLERQLRQLDDARGGLAAERERMRREREREREEGGEGVGNGRNRGAPGEERL